MYKSCIKIHKIVLQTIYTQYIIATAAKVFLINCFRSFFSLHLGFNYFICNLTFWFGPYTFRKRLLLPSRITWRKCLTRRSLCKLVSPLSRCTRWCTRRPPSAGCCSSLGLGSGKRGTTPAHTEPFLITRICSQKKQKQAGPNNLLTYLLLFHGNQRDGQSHPGSTEACHVIYGLFCKGFISNFYVIKKQQTKHKKNACSPLSPSDSANTMDIVLFLIWQRDVNHWKKK